MKAKKEILIIIILVFLLLISFVALSYGAFMYSKKGGKINQITTGTIGMVYEEGDNVINITNALPTTDETGKKQTGVNEYFDFSIKTNIVGNMVINYEIAAEALDGNTMNSNFIKYYLTRIDSNTSETEIMAPKTYQEEQSENIMTGRPGGMMSLFTATTNQQKESITKYRLRLYVDENYNPQGDGGNLIYRTRINVYGKALTE